MWELARDDYDLIKDIEASSPIGPPDEHLTRTEEEKHTIDLRQIGKPTHLE